METKKTYYQNSYLKSLSVQILETKADERGLWVCTDQTIAYPGGGGQLPDLVVLGGQNVLDIRSDNGATWYLVSDMDAYTSGKVEMNIDWNWRYYHMQQHTGQHLFSAVMKKHHYDTVSVHLGEEYTLVEFEGDIPEQDFLDQVEKECNEHIRQAADVHAFWIKAGEVTSFPLRRPAQNLDRLRLVHISGIDYVACGGTHVQNTSEIGYIKLVEVEKIRGHSRIKAYIGTKADEYFRQLHALQSHLKTMLHMDVTGMTERIQNLIDERTTLKRSNDTYVKYYLRAKGEEIIKKHRSANGVVFYSMDQTDGVYGEELARILAHEMNTPAFICFEDRFFFNVPESSTINPNRFLKESRENFGIKGGGPPGFVKGVFDSSKQEALIKTLHSL
jgi:alanyl-tRNA synthetase